MVWFGAFLFLIANPLGTAFVHWIVGGAAGIVGIVLVISGLWSVSRAGRTSGEVIEQVRKRRASHKPT